MKWWKMEFLGIICILQNAYFTDGQSFLEWLTRGKDTSRIEAERNIKFRQGVRQALRLQQGINIAGQSLALQCSGGRLDEVEESVDCVERDGRCCSVNNTGVTITWYANLAPGDYYACGYCWSGSAVFRINMGNTTPPIMTNGDAVSAGIATPGPGGLLKNGGGSRVLMENDGMEDA